MFMQNNQRGLAVVILLLLLPAAACAHGPQWKLVHGDVLQVLLDEHRLLVACDGQEQYLSLEEDCRIFRQGQPVSLASLRPVGPEAFQDVLCWISPTGLVGLILVNYHVQEENGLLVAYDIFGNPK
ncbi:MAG: hypothetical protein GX199_00965 [Firmicutes bacterium]|nr:hypothetical protein [Bacillota bacterium]